MPDDSVDLIVTSPPYWGLRDYTDGGASIAGQLGGEADYRDYLKALWAVTAECQRVLKPGGSLFVNLADKYSDRGHGPNRGNGTGRGPQGGGALPSSRGPMEKSLLNLPGRYVIGCTDDLGLAERAEIVWEKGNPLPESVKDRVRRSHEVLFHLVQGRFYYAGMDAIREALLHPGQSRTSAKVARAANAANHRAYGKQSGLDSGAEHPLGKIPGSVWRIPTAPLNAPRYYCRPLGVRSGGVQWLPGDADAWRWVRDTGRDRSAVPRDDGRGELRAAPDHYAAMPPALVRPLILGWSPPAVCLACGQGRQPVSAYTGEDGRRPGGGKRYGNLRDSYANLSDAAVRGRQIIGYACACTPSSATGAAPVPTVTPHNRAGRSRGRATSDAYLAVTGRRTHVGGFPERPPARVWHFDGWEPPPSRPAVVLDCCGGTGTVAMMASLLGRAGVSVGLSHDYGLLASWRVADPAERARALEVPPPPKVAFDQATLFDDLGALAGWQS